MTQTKSAAVGSTSVIQKSLISFFSPNKIVNKKSENEVAPQQQQQNKRRRESLKPKQLVLEDDMTNMVKSDDATSPHTPVDQQQQAVFLADPVVTSLVNEGDNPSHSVLSSPLKKKRRMNDGSAELSTPNHNSISELDTKISAARSEFEQKEQEFQKQFQLLSQMKNVSVELKNHEMTQSQLIQLQTEQLATTMATATTMIADASTAGSSLSTFPDSYTKLLTAYLQDDTEPDIDVLTDKIMKQWMTIVSSSATLDDENEDASSDDTTVRRRRRKKKESKDATTTNTDSTENTVVPSTDSSNQSTESSKSTQSQKKSAKASSVPSCLTQFNFPRELLKAKIDVISTLENYGVADAPEYSLFRREVIHLTHLPKELRDPLKERRKESKNVRKVLRNMHKDVMKCKKELQKLETKMGTQVQKQQVLQAKQEEKLKKMEEKEQKKKNLAQTVEQTQQASTQQVQQQTEKKKPSMMDISKFATKMKIVEQNTTVNITKKTLQLNVLSEAEIDLALQNNHGDGTSPSVTLSSFLDSVKQRQLLPKNWSTINKRTGLYVYSRSGPATEKILYVKKMRSMNSNPSVERFNARTIARQCWKTFQTEVDYDEPCYESADEEENDDDIEGEDILDDDEEDEEPLLGFEDYDEDEDHDFVVHDGYVSGNDDEDDEEDGVDEDCPMEVSGAKMKRKKFDREENIELKRKSVRKRGRGGIELITLDTQHFFYNDERMHKLESIQPIDTTEPVDFSDLSWFSNSKDTSDLLKKPEIKRKETNHSVLAEHKIPDECLREQEENRIVWKQYICNSSIQQLVNFVANGYEGGKQKLVDDFMTSFTQPKSKRRKVTKVLARKQIDEIVYKSDKQQLVCENGLTMQQQPRALFKVYQCIIDTVAGLPSDSDDSVSESNEEASELPPTPRRRRVVRRRQSLAPTDDDSDDEDDEEDNIPTTPSRTKNILTSSTAKSELKKRITYSPNPSRKRKDNPNKENEDSINPKKARSNIVSNNIADYFSKPKSS